MSENATSTQSLASNEGEIVQEVEGGVRQMMAQAAYTALTRMFLDMPWNDGVKLINISLTIEHRLAMPAHGEIPDRPERVLARAQFSIEPSPIQIVAPKKTKRS